MPAISNKKGRARCIGRTVTEVLTITRTPHGEYRVAPRSAWLIADRADCGLPFNSALVRDRAEALAYYAADRHDAYATAMEMFTQLDINGPGWPDEELLDYEAELAEAARIVEALGGPLPIEEL